MRLVLTNCYNDRGVRIDTKLVRQAITCDLLLSDAMTTKAYELTGLENPNSVSQLKTWLDERGISMDTLGKKNVTEMIGELDKNGVDAEAMDMLKLRLQMAKSSVKKYQAAERCVCPDGRARGLFQFYGASRTGRYSGRNIQLQNLPQNHISTLDEARTLVKMGCFDMVESIYGNTPDVLSQLIRTMLIPRNGCEFIVADFSAIEARVLAWEAGEQWVLDAFQNGEDLYCATASQMFHVPVVKHGINGDLRQKGKIATLACGYGGSSGALISMGALQMGLKEEELPEIIDSWREANPKIVQYWWDVEKAAMQAFKTGGRQDIGRISFAFSSGTLWMVLLQAGFQKHLAAHHRAHGQLKARQPQVGWDKIHPSGSLLASGLVDTLPISYRLFAGGLHQQLRNGLVKVLFWWDTAVAGKIALRVKVHHQDAVALLGQGNAEVIRCGRFPRAALLVCDCDCFHLVSSKISSMLMQCARYSCKYCTSVSL